MKKLYYGPMVLGLAALALGSQVTSVTTVLATDGDKVQEEQPVKEPETTDIKTPDTKTTDDGAKSTHGTWDEAIAQYNADLTRLETRLDSLKGENEMLTYVKGELAKLKVNQPKDGKELAVDFYELRVLGWDTEETEVSDITIKNGEDTETVKNVFAIYADTAGHGDMHDHIFKSGTNNIKLSDGSKLSLEFTDGKISKATITDTEGKEKDIPVDDVTNEISKGVTAEDFLHWLIRDRDDFKMYDQDNKLVQDAEKALPEYISWFSNEGKTSTTKEAEDKWGEYTKKYSDPISKANLKVGPDVFPNPDGTTYVVDTADLRGYVDPNQGSNTNSGNNNNNTNKPTTDTNKDNDKDDEKPTTKPADEKTIVAHPTTFMTSATDNITLYKEDGSAVKNRVLSKNSAWRADKMMTLNGVKYLRVATNEWVKLNDGLEIHSLNTVVTTKNQASLYTAAGKLVGNRALAANSPWRADRSATINGKTMYRVATNEWVSAEDVK